MQRIGHYQRLLLICVFTFSCQRTLAQKPLQTINANSPYVDIRVGDDYFAKGGWRLEPEKKPDVFSIGSKWLYEHKTVTFITDVDSISFDVGPGKVYDFIILLEKKKPCYIQIATRANPVFMDPKIILPIVFCFAIVLAVVYAQRRKINVLLFLFLGYVTPMLFWLMTIVSGSIHGHYDHAKNVISELGAIGTRSEIITSASLVLIALLSTLFSVGFYRASRLLNISVVPSVLSFSQPIAILWAAIFALGNEFHGAIGPLPIMITLASMLSFFVWRNHKDLLTLRILGVLSCIAMMSILLRFTQFGHEYEGFVQRLYYLGWTIWTISVAYFLSTRIKMQKLPTVV